MKKTGIIIAIMTIVTALIMIVPLLFPVADNEAAYCLVCYYIFFPLAVFTCGCASGNTGFLGKALIIICAGILGVLMPLTVLYSTKTITGLFGFGAAVLGVVLSSVIDSTKK